MIIFLRFLNLTNFLNNKKIYGYRRFFIYLYLLNYFRLDDYEISWRIVEVKTIFTDFAYYMLKKVFQFDFFLCSGFHVLKLANSILSLHYSYDSYKSCTYLVSFFHLDLHWRCSEWEQGIESLVSCFYI
jgi:hypothetical protein